MDKDLDVLLQEWQVDRYQGTPLFKQLANNIRYSLSLGQIEAGTKLPALRDLAKQLNLSIDTVRAAYQILEKEGLVLSRPHHGTEVIGLMSANTVQSNDPIETELIAAFAEVISKCRKSNMSDMGIQSLFEKTLYPMSAAAKEKKLLFIECNKYDEQMSVQLSEYLSATVDFMLLDDLKALKNSHIDFLKQYQAIVTTYFHYEDVQTTVETLNIPIFGIVVDINPEITDKLMLLGYQAKVGILCLDIHNQQQFKSVVQSFRQDILIEVAVKSDQEKLTQVVNWADLLIVNHPCEEDAIRIKPDCNMIFFYTSVINEKSLELLKNNLEQI